MMHLVKIVAPIALLALAACTAGEPPNRASGVYILLDSSGTYTQEVEKAQQIVSYTLSRLEPGDSFGGGGIYRPDMSTLTRIRTAIIQESKEWAVARERCPDIEGDRLTRAPAGFDPNHRFIEDLRRKDLYTLTSFSEQEVCSPDFMNVYVECCRASAPLVGFLSKAMGLRW